jgi:hypothetical protein
LVENLDGDNKNDVIGKPKPKPDTEIRDPRIINKTIPSPIPEPPKPMPIPQDAQCNFDMITSITKILAEAQASMGFKFEPKAIRVDLKDERKQKIEDYFQKPQVPVEESKELLPGHEEEDENMM